jgi:hypothetical protein
VLAVASAALAAGCSRDPGPTTVGAPAAPQASDATSSPASSDTARVRPPTPRSTASTGPRTDPAPTAAADLAPFFAAADVTDARIRAAAAAINQDIGPTTAHVRRPTRTLILASAPRLPAKAIPAGMKPDLQRAVLLVHSELVARAAAFNGGDRTAITSCRPSSPRERRRAGMPVAASSSRTPRRRTRRTLGYGAATVLARFGRMPETRFEERIAAHYETLWPELFNQRDRVDGEPPRRPDHSGTSARIRRQHRTHRLAAEPP